MKINGALSSLLLAGCAFGVVSTGFAATCNATQGTLSNANVGTPVPGNSCGHNANFNGATFCSGVSFSTTGTDAYAVTLSGTYNFSFSVTSAAFTPDVAFVSGNCADNATCIGENTTGTGTVTDPNTGTFSGAASGNYFIFVTDSTGTGAQCGAYNLTLTGTLPVKLQDFSIQ